MARVKIALILLFMVTIVGVSLAKDDYLFVNELSSGDAMSDPMYQPDNSDDLITSNKQSKKRTTYRFGLGK